MRKKRQVEALDTIAVLEQAAKSAMNEAFAVRATRIQQELPSDAKSGGAISPSTK